jgi:tetraacyldisaccharide 4'-kinase
MLPLSLIYGMITFIRNKFFDWGWYKELDFEIPLINVGNLAVGGTGKTPHIAYLIDLLVDKKVGVLSRGYGRGTKGFKLVSVDSRPVEVGDEMLMLKQKFASLPMAVHENRALGIAELLSHDENIDIILLDDAFQHRHVKSSINILLSEYQRPFFRDWVMPLGRLREWRSGHKRADVIVFTKCPPDILPDTFYKSGNPKLEDKTFFSRLEYPNLKQVHGDSVDTSPSLLVTSIAKPEYLFNYLKTKIPNLSQKKYRDHYAYKQKDILWMHQQNKSIICSYKDWVKLQLLDLPSDLNIWVQDVKIKFTDNKFDEALLQQLN